MPRQNIIIATAATVAGANKLIREGKILAQHARELHTFLNKGKKKSRKHFSRRFKPHPTGLVFGKAENLHPFFKQVSLVPGETVKDHSRGIIKMPRFNSKRKRTARGRRSKPAKRRRRAKRKSIVRKRKRSPRVSLARRFLPKQKMIKFIQIGQIVVTTNPNEWGVIRFPVNTMEKPFALVATAGGNHILASGSIGSAGRRPHGIDRWVGASVDTNGKYGYYEVKNCKITLQHIPSSTTTLGFNILAGTNTYASTQTEITQVGTVAPGSTTVTDDIYQNLPEGELAQALYPGGPFAGVHTFNSGRSGTVLMANWNAATAKRKKPQVILSTGTAAAFSQRHRLTEPEDITHFCVQDAHFMFGRFGDSATAEVLNFMVRMEYTCKLTEPTAFANEALDVNTAADNFA